MSSPDLDWTFGPAPSADDPPPNSVPRRSRPSPGAAQRLSRRTWLLLGAVGVLAVTLTLALPLIETARARRAVAQVVAAQEAARLAADWSTLGASYAADPLGWGVIHLQRLRNGWLPTPLSLPGLRADGQPGRVIRFQLVSSQLARADVERGFVLADGTPVTFAMPQFYQFTQAAGQPPGWRQTPPPEAASDSAEHIHGPRVDMTYYPDDGDLAAVVIANLGDLLTRACADWNCPPELHVAVMFDASDPASAASPAPYEPLMGSLALQVILGRPSTNTNLKVTLASRFTGGYPSNPAASEAVRRAVGVQALIEVAQQLAPNALQHGENAYLDAMIAREASRQGIDAPGLRQLQIANPLFSPADLWSIPLLHPATGGALPEALVVLNQFLVDRGLGDESKLMHGLNTYSDAQSWLAAELQLAPGGVPGRLDEALVVPFPAVLPPSFTPDLALSCPTGPLLATLAGQSAPLLAGPLPDSYVDVWSPDGQQMALRVSGRLSVVDVAHHAGQFLQLASWQEGIPPVWASNSVLVYPFAGSNPPTLGNAGLAFFNTSSRISGEAMPNYFSYVPSPAGGWAALVGPLFGSESGLSVIPAVGTKRVDSILRASGGYNPAWSADGQQLVFSERDGVVLKLMVYDLARGDLSMALGIGPGNGADPAAGNTDLMNLMGVLSPTGSQLAVATTTTNDGREFVGWLSLIQLRGGTDNVVERLPAPRDGLYPATLAYSADGDALSVTYYDSSGPRGVALYSAAGKLLRWLPGDYAGPWAPTGHALALIGLQGVSLLREPDAAPQPFGPAGCFGLAWRP
jgi:WD40-like Beta Propeller Repeat